MPNDADSRLRPLPISRPRGTNKPGRVARPGGTNKPGRPGGTNKPGRPGGTNKPGRPGGTNKPGRPGHTDVPGGEPDEPTSAVEDDRLTTNWIQYTERLKPGYSASRYVEWWNAWQIRQQGPRVKWKSVGPDNIGGRITCLAAPQGPSGVLLAGAACGGLWRQKAADGPWSSIDDEEANQTKDVRSMHNIGVLAADPNNPKIVYCGTGHAYHAGDSFPGVGLFQSTNGGGEWKLVAKADDDYIPHRISAIAVDPRPVEGDTDYRTRIRIGGVEVRIGAEEDTGQLSGRERPGMFYYGLCQDDETAEEPKGSTEKEQQVNKKEPRWHRDNFRLDPAFAKTIGASEKQANEGVFKQRDYQCHSIVHCENEHGKAVIMTAISGVLDWSGIWRSHKGGQWEHLTRGLPPGREFGRTSLATSRKDPRVVYAFIGSADGQCLGVFRTSDGGKHWSSPAGPDHFAACGRLNYTNCIAVHPEDPDLVVCGADDVHRSTDGGHTWTQVTEWFAARNSPGYAHKDHHALLWVKNVEQYFLYSGNDGGVNVSDDDGVTWKNHSAGLANLMFYDIDVAPLSTDGTGLIIAGGTQDNASVMTEIEASGVGYIPTELGVQLTELAVKGMQGQKVVQFAALSHGVQPAVRLKEPNSETHHFADMLYGDGGWIVFDPQTPLHLYGSSQFMTIYRHRIDDGWVSVTPRDATNDERGNTWMAYIAMRRDNSNVVFTGSTRLWRTQNDGDDWTPVSDHLDGSAISAIEISDNKPSVIYVGTENGNIFKSEDAGNRWSQQDGDPGPTPLEWRRDLIEEIFEKEEKLKKEEKFKDGTLAIPCATGRAITRIEADPNDAHTVLATLLGFDSIAKSRCPHVISFDTNAKRWKDADPERLPDGKRQLPNVHHNVVTWSGDPDTDDEAKPAGTVGALSRCVFVGNDVGVWMGTHLSEPGALWTWLDISGDLPNAIVTDLVYHRESRSLIAATYGRGIWQLDETELINAAPRQPTLNQASTEG